MVCYINGKYFMKRGNFMLRKVKKSVLAAIMGIMMVMSLCSCMAMESGLEFLENGLVRTYSTVTMEESMLSTMGMTVEDKIDLLYAGIGLKHLVSVLDVPCVAMEHQEPNALKFKDPLSGQIAQKVTVSPYRHKDGTASVAFLQSLKIPFSIAEMKDQIGLGAFYHPLHALHVTMGIGKDENTHISTSVHSHFLHYSIQ